MNDEASPATETEIGTEREKWIAGRRAEHRDFVKHFTFHKSCSFMDYLHGEVKPEEAPMACLYEYLRESPNLREAAKWRDEFIRNGPDGFNDAQRATRRKQSHSKRAQTAAGWALQRLRETPRLNTGLALAFLACQSFPQKDWQELTPTERQQILRFGETRKVPPLETPEAWELKALGILDQFKAMAEKSESTIEDPDPQRKFAQSQKPASILQGRESLHYIVLTLDFSETETRLVERFRAWLKLPEIKKLLSDFEKPPRNPRDTALDRLKDLAAWRLYREHKNDCQKANEFANKHRKQRKPFRDAKCQGGNRADEAELFGEDADARKAQAAAWKHLAEILPEEFVPPGAHTLAAFAELSKLDR